MILQSKDEFDKLVEMDADTGTYRLLSRKEHPEISSLAPSGTFSILNDTIFSLYRNHGVLHFRVGNRAVELTDDITSVLTSENNNRVFQLLRNGKPEIRFTYLPPENDVPLSADPTPFIEAEDFDFLLFVHHVLTESGRRKRVYTEQR
jgi:hypothetical protein